MAPDCPTTPTGALNFSVDGGQHRESPVVSWFKSNWSLLVVVFMCGGFYTANRVEDGSRDEKIAAFAPIVSRVTIAEGQIAELRWQTGSQSVDITGLKNRTEMLQTNVAEINATLRVLNTKLDSVLEQLKGRALGGPHASAKDPS